MFIHSIPDKGDLAMRLMKKVLVAVIALGCLNAWGDIKSTQEVAAEAKANAPHISAQQLATYLDDGTDVVLLDVRTEAEFDAGHIKGARWMPRGKLEYVIQEAVEDPDARIVLYCRTGGRSALAARTLLDMGYTNVVDLDGGFKAWVEQGNSLYNQHGELKVVEYQKEE